MASLTHLLSLPLHDPDFSAYMPFETTQVPDQVSDEFDFLNFHSHSSSLGFASFESLDVEFPFENLPPTAMDPKHQKSSSQVDAAIETSAEDSNLSLALGAHVPKDAHAKDLIVDGTAPLNAKSTENANTEQWIRFLRHKLQKGLLMKGEELQAKNMPAMSTWLKSLEKFESLPENVLRNTKILKVVKMIKNLDQIPEDSSLRIKVRAAALHQKWTSNLDSENAASRERQTQPTASLIPVIDLTGEAEPDLQRASSADGDTSSVAVGSGAAGAHEPESSSSSENTLPAHSTPRRNKRRRNQESHDGERSIEILPSRRKRTKTTVTKYVSDERQWMDESEERVEKILQTTREAIDFIEQHLGSLRKQEKSLTSFKKRMSAYGRQYQRVTNEWE